MMMFEFEKLLSNNELHYSIKLVHPDDIIRHNYHWDNSNLTPEFISLFVTKTDKENNVISRLSVVKIYRKGINEVFERLFNVLEAKEYEDYELIIPFDNCINRLNDDNKIRLLWLMPSVKQIDPVFCDSALNRAYR